MVTISGFIERKNSVTNEVFTLLELSGGLELVQSQNTGSFYATTRKCMIPCTFSSEVAQAMIGTQLDGDVVRVEVDPYDYIQAETGELMRLTHSYSYRPKGSMELIGESRIELNDPAETRKRVSLTR